MMMSRVGVGSVDNPQEIPFGGSSAEEEISSANAFSTGVGGGQLGAIDKLSDTKSGS
jgi:hypothetical protein